VHSIVIKAKDAMETIPHFPDYKTHPDFRQKIVEKRPVIPLVYKMNKDFRQHFPGKKASYTMQNIVCYNTSK
jgi:hypothetical protein